MLCTIYPGGGSAGDLKYLARKSQGSPGQGEVIPKSQCIRNLRRRGHASPFILEVDPIIGLICPSASIMPRFRKSKSSAKPPVSTPALPVEPVQNLTSQRDPKTLVASSTAIAPSISSAFRDIRGTPSNDTTARGKDTGWQTAYDAAKIAIEITKESSDMFLPLKAVVGAISVLIKNYDVGVPNSRSGCLLIHRPFPAPANVG